MSQTEKDPQEGTSSTARAPTCTYEGQTYQVGETACFKSTKTKWKCGTTGQWFDTKEKCTP